MMRKKNYKGRCIKRTANKAEGVCRTYDALQFAALDILDKNDEIAEIRCNVVLEGSEWEMYTTDFLCKTTSGDWMAFETCYQKLLARPQTMKLLDASRTYWQKRGVNWGLIVDEAADA